jgi:hypothetical protein
MCVFAECLVWPRDIYYIDPEYFRSQTIVDGVIDDLAYTIGVDRAALHVVRSVSFSNFNSQATKPES